MCILAIVVVCFPLGRVGTVFISYLLHTYFMPGGVNKDGALPTFKELTDLGGKMISKLTITLCFLRENQDLKNCSSSVSLYIFILFSNNSENYALSFSLFNSSTRLIALNVPQA